MCNERAALLLRTLGPTPTVCDNGLGDRALRAYAKLRGIAHCYGQVKWSYLETAESYSGSLRRRYLEAERSLRLDGPVGHRDYELRAFLKAEKLSVRKFTKPRMIFPRSPRYNLTLASWLKPFEHWLWGYLTARRFFGGSNTRIAAKGLSPRQRANLIVRKFSQFEDCVCFEVDGKAFEAHLSRPHLEQEHSVYLAAYHEARPLDRLLRHQLVLQGVTTGGWKFKRDGGRASGDFNTGMGNTLDMLVAVRSAMHGRGIPWDVLADGDNALLFVPRLHYRAVRSDFAARVLSETGHEMEVERPAYSLEAVRFGQSAPVYLGPSLGWTMVRDVRKILSGVFASHRWHHDPVGWRRWVAGVIRCELSLAVGVPVLQGLFSNALKQMESVKLLRGDAYRDYQYLGARPVGLEAAREVTLEARLSFERAFGISLEEQRRQEAHVFRFAYPGCVPNRKFHTADQLWEAWPGQLELCYDSLPM